MTKEQVELLRAAGISESAIIDRILGETKPEPEEKTEPGQDPEPEMKQEPDKKTEPEKEPDPEKKTEPEKKPETEDKILKAIEKLTGAVLSRNINTIGTENTPEESADEVLGSLLRGEPNIKGGK